MNQPIRTYVLLQVDQRFPLRERIADLCANGIFSHESVLDVNVVAAAPLLHDLVAAIDDPPTKGATP